MDDTRQNNTSLLCSSCQEIGWTFIQTRGVNL